MASGGDAKAERTFIMLKPESIQRSLVAEVIRRFELKGFKLIAMKFQVASEDHIKNHYKEHEGKKFFPGLVKHMSSGPVIPMVWEGKEIVKTVRAMLGQTNPVWNLK
jgi:nucleoside-diphosphate kinase